MHPLDHLARLDAVAQAALVAQGELQASDLVDACQRRHDLINPLLRAVVAADFEAARRRAAAGVSGPLAGVPFLFKDLNAYPGLRCAYGSRLFGRNVPASGTPFTDRADVAGLITVGKSASSEFGLLGSTETLLEGVTHNPWNLSLTATGSSGGAASAVAAGIVPLAHASDAGGSIRIPASATGLFGFKPSRGRTVRSGPAGSDFDALLSDGCISRSVRDTALFLSLVEDGAAGLPPLGHVREPARERLRIGVTRRTLIGSEPEPDVQRALDASAALCAELGHEVSAAPPPAVDGLAVSAAFFSLAGATLAGMVTMLEPLLGRRAGKEELEPFTLALIEAARGAPADVLAGIGATFRAATAAYLEAIAPFDVVLTPTLATRPWPLGWLAPTLAREELIARTERSVCYTPIQTIAGCPAMSVPLYWAADGVPIGSQFAAAPGHDARLMALAYELEAARPWAGRWAPHSFVSVAGA
ncbi:MAG TPA: amidase family protein [Polyangiaceae bacterium]|nr:amidase family protein [Polyangiaceae bacterium]